VLLGLWWIKRPFSSFVKMKSLLLLQTWKESWCYSKKNLLLQSYEGRVSQPCNPTESDQTSAPAAADEKLLYSNLRLCSLYSILNVFPSLLAHKPYCSSGLAKLLHLQANTSLYSCSVWCLPPVQSCFGKMIRSLVMAMCLVMGTRNIFKVTKNRHILLNEDPQ